MSKTKSLIKKSVKRARTTVIITTNYSLRTNNCLFIQLFVFYCGILNIFARGWYFGGCNMALGLLFYIFIAILIFDFLTIILLFFKKGKWSKNNFVFVAIQLYVLILVYIYITSLPTNYTGSRIFGGIIGVIVILSIFFKKHYFLLARILLVLSLVILTFILFL